MNENIGLSNPENKYKILFILSIFLPFVTFGLFQSDLSPFYLLFLSSRVFLLSKSSNNAIILAIIIALFLTIFSIFVNYDTRIIKFCATIIIAETLYRIGVTSFINFSTFRIVAIFWLITGIITILYPNIFNFLFYRVGTTEGRGATGLTPEPSYYGISSAFLYSISKMFDIKYNNAKKNQITQIIFCISCLISGSLHAIIVLILLALKFQKKILLILLIIFPFFFFFMNMQQNIRLFNLINNAIDSNGLTLLEDASIAYRITSFDAALNMLNSTDSIVVNSSGFGITILFINQGVFGLIWLIILVLLKSWRMIYKLMFNSIYLFILVLLFLFIGPLSNPFFWIFIGSYVKIYINKNII